MAIRRDAADKWFSDVVRKKAGYVCEHCNTTGARMKCAHIYGSSAKSVLLSMANALCLCHSSHMKFTSNSFEFPAFCMEPIADAELARHT